MMKPIKIMVLVLVILPSLIFAQDITGTAVFAPFISRLSAEVKNNLVRLSWIDSQDIRGPVYIYRSKEPFTGEIPRSRPAEVPYGVQTYVDEAESGGVWYYYIAASDETGRQFTVLVPFTNTVSVMVEAGEVPARSQEQAPSSPLSPPSPEEGIVSLEAALEGGGVLISFRSGGAKNVILYRSAKPLKTTQDLLGAVIVQSGVSSPFMDYPVPGIPSYYGAIPEEDLIAGRVRIFPGYNATITPVEVPTDQSGAGFANPRQDIRTIPLPLMTVTTAVPESRGIPEIPAPLSAGAARAVSGLGAESGTTEDKRPRAFSQDLENFSGGGDYPLRSIVQNSFMNRHWDAARDELIRYLSLRHSGPAEARGRYYLGQTYYFQGKHREALFEFLYVQSHYPEEANDWIQAVLAKLAK
jgi:hypothetical protein